MTTAAHDDHLLERDEANAHLEADLEHARLGVGRIVLVGAEAGGGKTSLVRSFTARHGGDVRFLSGACEALFTPRPLGPVYDIVQGLDHWSVEAPTTDADRTSYFGALLEELRAHPTVAVFEDVHWADEATLDALKYLGRRIESSPSLLVLTFRDDELGAHHALRLLGDLPSGNTTRISLAPLSPRGVAELARRARTTGARALRGDRRQPVLRHRSSGCQRRRHPGDGSRRCPCPCGSPERWRATPAGRGRGRTRIHRDRAPRGARRRRLHHLAECLASGMLDTVGRRLGFRHELARLAIEQSLTPDRRIALNEIALRALAAQPEAEQDLSALAHHADVAGDAEAVRRFAPQAARGAAAVGAHREAAEQYARALSYHVAEDEERLSLLEGYALQAGLTGRYDAALEARQNAIALARTLDDRLRLGENLARVMSSAVSLGLNDLAEEANRESIEILEKLPPGRELALAYTSRGGLRMLTRDNAEGVDWGLRGLDLAEARRRRRHRGVRAEHDRHVVPHGQRNRGGRPYLERSLQLATEHGLHSRVANAYAMLASGLGELYELAESERWAREFVTFATEHDLDAAYIRSWLAAALVYQGRWGRRNRTRTGTARRRDQLDHEDHRARGARTRPRTARRPRRRRRARWGARHVARERSSPATRPRLLRTGGGCVARG